jgi:hypothetical protein
MCNLGCPVYEFIYFLHFKYMNSYKYDFISCMIHIFFAVIMYEFIYFWQKLQAHASRERATPARNASAQRELLAHSMSREGEALAPNQATPDLCRSDPIHLNLNLDT